MRGWARPHPRAPPGHLASCSTSHRQVGSHRIVSRAQRVRVYPPPLVVRRAPAARSHRLLAPLDRAGPGGTSGGDEGDQRVPVATPPAPMGPTPAACLRRLLASLDRAHRIRLGRFSGRVAGLPPSLVVSATPTPGSRRLLAPLDGALLGLSVRRLPLWVSPALPARVVPPTPPLRFRWPVTVLDRAHRRRGLLARGSRFGVAGPLPARVVPLAPVACGRGLLAPLDRASTRVVSPRFRRDGAVPGLPGAPPPPVVAHAPPARRSRLLAPWNRTVAVVDPLGSSRVSVGLPSGVVLDAPAPRTGWLITALHRARVVVVAALDDRFVRLDVPGA